jgi:SpoVK/Ycf46/Vps4 family AAA+-type ATPase
MDSLCTVLFFDEIDALGHSRGPSELGAQSSNNDGCSRRVLAELLIQLTCLQSTAKDDELDFIESEEQNENYFPMICTPDDIPQTSSSKVDNSSLEIDDEDNVNRDRQKVRVIVVAATNRPEDCDPALLRRFSVRVNVGLPACRDRRKIISKFLSELDHTITKAQLKEISQATEGWSGCDLESLTREAAMTPIRECLRSAAMLKRRARKMEQQGGDESTQGLKKEPVNADEEARDKLLRDFGQLRPVTLEDFENAYEFWLGNQQTTSTVGTTQPKRKQVHYDSGSSSESEEE